MFILTLSLPSMVTCCRWSSDPPLLLSITCSYDYYEKDLLYELRELLVVGLKNEVVVCVFVKLEKAGV
eukprot:m.159423 g.159423  ORF g.159423 m.159423 type:complete len:68 (-) comp24794_c0_seq4:25-228(-)